MGGGKIKGIKWLFYFSFLLKMITFAVYFYPLLHRDGTVQILQNLLVRIIYHGIVQRIQVNKRSPFAAVSSCGVAYMRTKVMVRQAIYPTVSIFGYGSSTRSDIAGKPDLAVHR